MWLAVTAVAEHSGHCTVRLVAVRDSGRDQETVVRLLIERNPRRTLRALDERWPERTVDAGNETDIRGVSRHASSSVPPKPSGPATPRFLGPG